jgi:LysR family hydrogen peroxide-inducible transcriptional activator
MNNFIKKYPKVNLIIEERTTEEIIRMLKNGQLDAAIAATPLGEETIKEIVLYYEPFVAYVPENNAAYSKKEFSVEDLEANLDNLLLLQDGHCFRNNVLNVCRTNTLAADTQFQIESGSFETLVRLADEGLGMTVLPYLHTLDMSGKAANKLKHFKEPRPSREVSLIYSKKELKLHIIEALRGVIAGVVRGAIAFQNVDISSPVHKK